MTDMTSQHIWIGNELYTVEYPSRLDISSLKTEQPMEEIPLAQEPEAAVNEINDEWDERKGLFYTVVQMIFAFLILTQGAGILKSIIIGALLLLIGLTQLGYISWSNWAVNAARIVQPGPAEDQQPVWKTLFLLSINFILSLFPGLNEIG